MVIQRRPLFLQQRRLVFRCGNVDARGPRVVGEGFDGDERGGRILGHDG
jgi:hypothetical protein